MQTKSAESLKQRLALYGYRLRQRSGDCFDVIDLRDNSQTIFATTMRAVREWFAEDHPRRARRAA